MRDSIPSFSILGSILPPTIRPKQELCMVSFSIKDGRDDFWYLCVLLLHIHPRSPQAVPLGLRSWAPGPLLGRVPHAALVIPWLRSWTEGLGVLQTFPKNFRCKTWAIEAPSMGGARASGWEYHFEVVLKYMIP